jgi:hypothetical protein
MILAQPVENANGMALCASGRPLTQSLIDRFIDMGVVSVFVEGESLNPAQMLKARKTIETRFTLADGCPVAEMLKNILLARLE